MRLLLDAQISGRAVGRALQRRGHDVRALNEERSLEGLRDADVLALAASEQRILVTLNVGDFVLLLRRWAEAGYAHSGCILIVGMRSDDFGLLVGRISAMLSSLPNQESWLDRTVYLGPEEAS